MVEPSAADGQKVIESLAMSTEVVVYSTRFCPYCVAAKALLKAKGVTYREVPVDGDADLRREMSERAGQRTVPQIWIGDRHVGGFTDLAALEQGGTLDELLRDAHKPDEDHQAISDI
jgi:glutaredoxin 3